LILHNNNSFSSSIISSNKININSSSSSSTFSSKQCCKHNGVSNSNNSSSQAIPLSNRLSSLQAVLTHSNSADSFNLINQVHSSYLKLDQTHSSYLQLVPDFQVQELLLLRDHSKQLQALLSPRRSKEQLKMKRNFQLLVVRQSQLKRYKCSSKRNKSLKTPVSVNLRNSSSINSIHQLMLASACRNN
jgi:hypothetical protein